MPRLSAWLIRAALLYLMLGFSLGALLLWHKGMPIHAGVWRLLPAHMEFLLLGWTVQLVLGVAYWILPRVNMMRPKTVLAWLSFGLLNGGIWLVAASGLFARPAAIQVTGRLLEVVAALAFALHAWLRLKWSAPVKR